PEKAAKVKELMGILEKNPIIALADVKGIGAPQLQTIRNKLRGQAEIFLVKNTLLKIALKEIKGKPNLDKLIQYVQGNCLLVATKMDPFKLQWFLNDNKSKAPAKRGQISPVDILVPSGDTGFQPGPLITQLNSVGLPTKIQNGTINITRDTVVAEVGDEISLNLVIALSRLKIYPMEVGISLLVAYDKGAVVTDEVLNINIDGIAEQIRTAGSQALNLAFEVSYVTPETIQPLLKKAHQQALSLAGAGGITTPDTIPLLLTKAEAQAKNLSAALEKVEVKAKPAESSASKSKAKPKKGKEKKVKDKPKKSPKK
ncbi:MAG: 50S ribosomal protein L10, partial [Candidatus Ranarchaeia archaeon]